MALTIVNSGIGAYLSGDAYIKALIMGEPGAGKTRSASFWPQPIFANCERKSMSLLDRNVPVANIGSVAEMDQLMLVLRADGQRPLLDRKYKTLVVDTFDAYQRTMINERLLKEHREKMINDDWNWLGTRTAQLLERISNLPMNVVINLHVKDVTEGEGDDKVVKQKPHLKGDVKDQIAAEFDLVGYMESYWAVEGDNPHERKKVLRRRIQWEQDERHPILKDCSGQLGTYTVVDFTDEDFTRIWQPIFIDNNRLDSFPESISVQVEVPGEAEAAAQPAAVAPATPPVGGPTVTAEQATKAAEPKKAPPRKAPAKAAAKAAPATNGASPAPASPETPPAAASSSAVPSQQPAEQPPAASTDTATDVPVQVEEPAEPPAPTADEAAAAVSALAEGGLTGEVVSEEPAADPSPVPSPAQPPAPAAAEPPAPAAPSAGLHCGDGEPAPVGKFDGCGKDLMALPTAQRDRAELAWMRWRVRLCPECFEKAKNNQLPARAA